MTPRPAHRHLRLHPERGATAVEYALMITFIAFVIITAVIVLGERLSGIFANAGTLI